MNKIKITFVSIIIVVLCSCSTKALWSDPKYLETVESFLITEDGKQFVVIGQKYHYIFPVSEGLKNILLSEKRALLTPRFYDFKVGENNRVTGSYRLEHFARENKVAWLEGLGFENSIKHRDKKSLYVYLGELDGARYTANKPLNIKNTFYKPYKISIKENSTVLGNLGKVLVTPVTVAYDGLITVGVVGALAIVFTYNAIPGSSKKMDLK